MQYTVQTTFLLGIVLVFLTYIFYNFCEKFKIKIDKNFAFGISMWVLLAAFVRVFEDANIYPKNFFTVTPGIIILFAIIILPVFLIGLWLEKNNKFSLWKTLSISALIPIIIHIPFLRIANFYGVFLVLSIFGAIFAIMFFSNKIIGAGIFSFMALAAHMFDATTTFVAMQFFGYYEQHLLPTILINLSGPWVMFLLKIIFIVPIIYLINKYSEEENIRKFLLLAIFVIGLAPALRNLLRLAIGV